MSLLAPPLKTRARWYWRAIQTAVLTAAVIVGLAVCSVLSVASYYLVEKRATPVEIYHNSWLAVRNNLHDQTRLKDWDSWEHRFDDQIKTDEDAIFYARKMVESLDDPYTAILDPHQTKASYDGAFGKFVGVGIEFDVLTTPRGDVVTTPDGRVLPRVTQEGFPVTRSILRGSPAAGSGLLPDDVLLSIEGKTTAGLSLDELRELLQGEAGTQVRVVVATNGQPRTVDLVRSSIAIPVVSTKILPGNVGYLRIESWTQLDTVDQIKAGLLELKDCDSLVIDVRDNGGGLIHLVFQALPLFMDSGKIATEHNRLPGEGYFSYTPSISSRALWIEFLGIAVPLPRETNLAGGRKMVVLVNEGTASASEIFAAALKENGRAVLVGKRTYGKGIGQTYVPVGDGVRVRVTNFTTTTPQGNWAGDAHKNRIGIEPTIEVDGSFDPRRLSRHDEQLQRALEHLAKP